MVVAHIKQETQIKPLHIRVVKWVGLQQVRNFEMLMVCLSTTCLTRT